ncbi:hypothetical protein L202_07944 [Cryptococcus amylolentus CBS 6039]|uniref:Alpha/beta hydrolase fold-3 domain-containing protein n=2 Tax=Cryptococcus amylolentus TaxID=104669 RepID=A0A1E3HAQ1_9TREE|nr:hypothetical protein L202_07944 [Cryptococcus amylolentus CBS 6039]ODN73419.1 hypothetical protein L202_07944 [Cryptococcus amylolentus CBS 6039]ODN99192.1 hypothetical protein I350_07351 [Cryptococcus amylolentus CBS 6273]
MGPDIPAEGESTQRWVDSPAVSQGEMGKEALRAGSQVRDRLPRKRFGPGHGKLIRWSFRELTCAKETTSLRHSHPVTIPPAPGDLVRGHIKETLQQLHDSRGAWDPHFVYRKARKAAGAWGAWNLDDGHQRDFGFEPVKGFWFTGEKTSPVQPPTPRLEDDPVMLHFHGGGYLCGTAAETDLTSSICKSLVKYSPIHHILSVDYRLAPKGPWPLPLMDAISAYRWLVKDRGIGEADIVLGGDSAGGHLALALARWLRDEGAAVGLNMPRGVVLFSPWSDLGFTNAWGKDEYRFNADSDVIDDTFGPFACSLLMRAQPISLCYTSPYVSPAASTIPTEDLFTNFPPTYIAYGSAERLARSIQTLFRRLQSGRVIVKQAVQDKIFVGPDAVHDFAIFPWMEAETAMMYEDLDGWLRELLSTEIEIEDEATEEADAVSPLVSASVFNSPMDDSASYRRLSRQRTRESLKSNKSPVMGATPDSGMLRMVEDMKGEGMSMIDIPKLDLDAPASRKDV